MIKKLLIDKHLDVVIVPHVWNDEEVREEVAVLGGKEYFNTIPYLILYYFKASMAA